MPKPKVTRDGADSNLVDVRLMTEAVRKSGDAPISWKDKSGFYDSEGRDLLAEYRHGTRDADAESMRRFILVKLAEAILVWRQRLQRVRRHLWIPYKFEPWALGLLTAALFLVTSLKLSPELVQVIGIGAAVTGAVTIAHRLIADPNGGKREYMFRLETMVREGEEIRRHLIREDRPSVEQIEKLFREVEIIHTVMQPDQPTRS